MDTYKINQIESMINKECQRDSLVELCEYWDVTIEDYCEFMGAAIKTLSSK